MLLGISSGHCSNHWKFLIICSSLRKDISVEWWTLAYPQWMNCANVKTWNLVGGLSSLAPTIYLPRLHGFLAKECKTNQISLSTTTTTTKSKIYLLKMHFKGGMTPTTPTHKMYLRKYFDDFKTRGQKIMILLASSNCNLNLEFLLPLATFFRKCNCNSGAF